MSEFAKKRQAIRVLMEYAVPEDRMNEAMDLLDQYRHDRIALDLLYEFYSFLPEARSDWVREIRLLGRRKGICLLSAMTSTAGFIYLISSEGLEFQGNMADGLWDRDLLDYFGFSSRESCQQMYASPDNYPVYEPVDSDLDICPACHAATGEVHELGCPVEICPWCGGQLVYCNCRFDKLETDGISNDQDLLRFEVILNARGRIPYAPEQRPSFADDGPGVIIE